MDDVRYVYILSSIAGRHFYVGVTADVRRRLRTHNAGDSPHTSKYRPWELIVAVEFRSAARAYEFERYLKSGSGRAFAKRHFAPRDNRSG